MAAQSFRLFRSSTSRHFKLTIVHGFDDDTIKAIELVCPRRTHETLGLVCGPRRYFDNPSTMFICVIELRNSTTSLIALFK